MTRDKKEERLNLGNVNAVPGDAGKGTEKKTQKQPRERDYSR
jgi:hypothetical protein